MSVWQDNTTDVGATDQDDAAIVQRAVAGDAGAFDQLVRRHAPRLLRMTYALVGNREDAEDLMQEALARAYFKLDTFAGRSAFFTWLYRIVLNLSISRRRRRRLESTHRVGRLEEAPSPIDNSAAADDTVETQEQLQQMRNAIAKLDVQRRTVLVLRDVEGLDYAQIAELLNLPKGTVRSRLHRARADLRQWMGIDPQPTPASATSATTAKETAS